MPEEPVTGRQSKQTRQSVDLLDRLKSLSEVTNFCLFTNHDPTFQQAIEHVQERLQLPVITPDIQYRAFYPGRRKAAIDLWAHQGWISKEEASDRQEKDSYDNAAPCTKLSAKRKAIDIADQGYDSLPASSPLPEYAACASHPVPSASSLC
ncbi:hypothetical protein KCU77_g1527, partial [Aureobasidium melanogenum]